ncbi:hypothetical protein BJ875DRAFT_104121 [Amylocarpus encephaloides]|uniref:Uncharacterized protein n=1 Tax=Amylocarpus encephaloides TaxID=45428 RepID=A0A9P7YEX1_9HELO|nr:hypothetical protein BJ875DRAFT_104121 [Amylocarpus encephaloides]
MSALRCGRGKSREAIMVAIGGEGGGGGSLGSPGRRGFGSRRDVATHRIRCWFSGGGHGGGVSTGRVFIYLGRGFIYLGRGFIYQWGGGGRRARVRMRARTRQSQGAAQAGVDRREWTGGRVEGRLGRRDWRDWRGDWRGDWRDWRRGDWRDWRRGDWTALGRLEVRLVAWWRRAVGRVSEEGERRASRREGERECRRGDL